VTRLPFVDAHFHLWDRERLQYPWLDAPEQAAIAGTYTLADYRAETAAWNVAGAVHVEAGAHADDALRETEWLEGFGTLPTAIVAQVALDDPAIDRRLAEQATHPRVRGVRQIVNWHPDPAQRVMAHDPVATEAWVRGYARLAAHGFSFDFHGLPPQLAGLAAVAARHPDVPLIVNHLGLPIPADGLDAWRAGIAALAALPHAAIKLSGAGFATQPFGAGPVAELVREVIDRFGTRRVLIASNLPTDRLAASLDTTLGWVEDLLADLSGDERRDLWGRNADRVYRLGLNL
jgi:predicted TIM-barrel fold metal-dependent hydrolase